MNNKLLSVGIGVVLVSILAFIVAAYRGGISIGVMPEQKSVMGLISEGELNDAKNKLDEITDKKPGVAAIGKLYFELAEAHEKNKDIVSAVEIYNVIMAEYQNIDNITEVQEKIGKLNMEILFSPLVTNADVLYVVEPGDTLTKIAKKFRTTVDLIKASNSLNSDTIRARSKLKVSKAKYKILVDKSQNLLTLLSDDGSVVKVYRVSTGENNCTPAGTFTIVNKIIDPVWYNEGVEVPAESPDNILGSRWLGFSKKGYGIHGTTEPESIGKQATRGCVRMLTSEVEELYTIIPLETEVTIVD